MSTFKKKETQKAADIVSSAGGKIVGRTRLQKIGYLLEITGLGDGFEFEYRHYGPYSEALATASRNAALLDLIDEEELQASWGGHYSIFTSKKITDTSDDQRATLAKTAAEADAIELELAATAAFLYSKGFKDAWEETARRKPEKATNERIQQSKELYEKLSHLDTPIALPKIQ
ncbi:hypothetical protein JZX86_05555 [Agrobacterium rosae]|uniref:hypothetical protein n=1 Tax=Agrobacterium rosae TaxID=1972867 RepID=UPI0019D34630|nr:hypothetical protein [Agrobacterium rosae]MBN7804830.1 hypothetical protein [Agrobacterium rosae]